MASSFAAYNVPYRAIEALFAAGSPELEGLVRIATTGMGSDTTIAADVIAAISYLEENKLKPLLRRLVDEKVPVAVLFDESTAQTDGRRSWLQLHVFASTMTEPEPFDVFILFKSGTGANIADAVKASLTREGYFSADEFACFVKIAATDHASAVLSAAKMLGTTSVGDPPHAVELVLKRMLRGLGLRPVLIQLRKVFTRKNSTAHRRVLEGFGILVTLFNM